ncbi:aldose 1-epimerase (Mutarotase) [Treponema primitia ZAS-2]|uniref:Aldose 1-epimerase n=1 Tax=Treponema primitia (strain ATCC BAA-887 / DSM 12427 / ZAS-2) TaxID=545694 RepID=F5YR74_TREPZ|nr:aldose epimerase family protein [Treponema primitia]AEF85087.1 aldose 1-epimerase (Mutarotase) [Treponema primitia ZAS-2]
MKITEKTFGILSTGKKATLFTLKAGELTLSLSSFGAIWTSLLVPSGKEGTADILLGYSTLDGYTHNKPHIGATIGRFGNRIRDGRFALNGKTYTLPKNDGEHCLHGGLRGFDKLLWKGEAYKERDGVFVRFELRSPDGDQGFPGNLKAVVSYGITKSHEIIADYRAKVDTPCPINLTNHAYFNLAGEGSGDILDHELELYASSYLAVDSSLIPTGELTPTAGSPFDFSSRKPIGRDFQGTLGKNGSSGPGYDHCFVVDGENGKLRPCADVLEPRSGRSMRVFTTQPGVQFYTGNFLDDLPGKAGSVYTRHSGFCLETQYLPDSPNRGEFPSCIFGPQREYHEKAIFSLNW